MIKLIAAMDPSGLLGYNNTIPWSYPADMKRFKKLTIGCVLIMGKNTALSLPKKLPKRKLIVISDEELPVADYTVADFDQAVQKALDLGSEEIWIAGGGYVYRQALEKPLVDYIDLTVVPLQNFNKEEVKDVVYFPKESLANYQIQDSFKDEVDPRIIHQIYTQRR